MLLKLDKGLLQDFCTLRVRHWNVLLFSVWLTLFCSFDGHSNLHATFNVLAMNLLSCTASRTCFGLFYRFLNGPSHVFNYLADASYSIYLFHHVVVIGLGYALLTLPIPAVAKFGLIVVTTYAVTLALHHFSHLPPAARAATVQWKVGSCLGNTKIAVDRSGIGV